MKDKKLHNKKLKVQLILTLIFIIALIVIYYTLSRYVFVKQDTHIQQAEEFYFNSSVLKENNPIYYTKEWNGQGVYTIAIDLNNFEDTIRKTNTNINYTVSAQTSNTNVTVAASENTGIINANETTKTVNINLTPINNLEEGENIEVIVQVNTTFPYAKQLSGAFNVCKRNLVEFTSNLIDNSNDEYAVLSITTKQVTKPIIISYDITKSTLDTTNSVFNNVNIINNSSVTLNLDSNKNYNIEFIKKTPANVLVLGTDITVESGN